MKPLTPLNPRPGLRLAELFAQMEETSFGARAIGQAWHVLRGILDDPECRVVLTISGALSVAQLGGVFRAMVTNNILDAVVTTGAVVTHQLVVELALKQFRLPVGSNDEDLAARHLYRVYDSIEPETNLEALETFVATTACEFTGSLGSADLIRRLSRALPDSSGWLGQAVARSVPVFVPALTDSELGLALYASSGPLRRFRIDPMADLDEFAKWLRNQKRIAVITLGGGVPRNWAMQMIPFLRNKGETTLPRVVAGIRICPDSAVYGHLSGSTYAEATTWGKLDTKDLPHFAEVVGDSTIVFPVLMLAAFERLAVQPRSASV